MSDHREKAQQFVATPTDADVTARLLVAVPVEEHFKTDMLGQRMALVNLFTHILNLHPAAVLGPMPQP